MKAIRNNFNMKLGLPDQNGNTELETSDGKKFNASQFVRNNINPGSKYSDELKQLYDKITTSD